MKVLILAAGYAVRLQPLTLNAPKPLLDVGRRKIIDRILDKAWPLNCADSVYVISNAKFFDNFKIWAGDSKHKDNIHIINDSSTSNDNRLGAIRDLGLAVKEGKIDDDLLVIAGDNLFEFELNDFLKFAKAHQNGVSIALYDISDREAAKRFGVVSIGGNNEIIDFAEKPPKPKSTLISTCVYYFPKDKLPLIDKYLSSSGKKDAPGYYIKWMSEKHKVYGFVFSEGWYDIGDIESYKKADKYYLEKEKMKNDKT